MSSNHDNRESTLVEYEAAALKLALHYFLFEEGRAARSEEMDPETTAFCEKSDKQIMEALRKRENALRRKAAFKTIIPLAAKVAIYLVLLGNLAASIAFASSATVRARVMKFFEQDYETHTTVGFVETGESLDIPADWTAPYYPAYIPEGFSLTEVVSFGSTFQAHYTDDAFNNIYLIISGTSSIANIDSEGMRKSTVIIHGTEGILFEGDDECILVWHNSDLLFTVQTTLPSTECRRIADSFLLIKR